MPTPTDTEIHEALLALRELEPTAAQTARVVRTARPGVVGRSHRMRTAVAAGSVAVVAAAALIGLPSSSQDRPGAQALLIEAAEAAGEQPPAPAGEFRWVKTVDRVTYAKTAEECAPCGATMTFEQAGEQWSGADWHTGKRSLGDAAVVARSGDPSLQRRLTGIAPKAFDTPLVIGDGALEDAPVADLPTSPDELRELLQAAVLDLRWVPEGRRSGLRDERPASPTPEQARALLVRAVVGLLADANLAPDLRSALFTMLAGVDGARTLGRVTDPIGRSADAVAFALSPTAQPSRPAVARELRIFFSSDTGELLAWSDRQTDLDEPPAAEEIVPEGIPLSAGVWMPAEEHVLVRTGYVEELGRRP